MWHCYRGKLFDFLIKVMIHLKINWYKVPEDSSQPIIRKSFNNNEESPLEVQSFERVKINTQTGGSGLPGWRLDRITNMFVFLLND